MSEMPKAYEPQQHEDEIYARWEESGSFIPENLPDFANREPYTIPVPPPNATATLHIGHAAMLAIEDVLIRYQRMNGKRALWIPGTDHAAIATQNVVEKMILKEEGKSRHDLGRAELVRRIEEFVESKRNRIKLQFRKMGASLDWSREAFTLDEQRSRAVRRVFKNMFDDGVIYRGWRVINWCPRCASTLSDDELETKPRVAKLYYFKYNKDFPITIATTQPETKLGDTAVAVHPSDERYTALVGKTFDVPFGGPGGVVLKIRVVADHNVEKEFGTGALGVTPAHSMIDYLMALQNNLPLVHVIGEDTKMLEAAGKDYAGLPYLEAREKVVAWLRAENLIEKEEDTEQNAPICERCKTEIIPLPKLQWFVDVNKKFAFQKSPRKQVEGIAPGTEVSLKEVMRHVVETDQITMIPERFEKTYMHWVDNLLDWCISRQLWYGHRIPVWFCVDKKTDECAAPICSVDEVIVCPHCSGAVEQDPDVLDTWFSSGTWTFSTLGWPYTRVIFVRHGECETNAGGFLNSDVTKEFHLTEKGRAQVATTTEMLAKEKVSAVFASPFMRGQETAAIIANALQVPTRTDDRLREAGLGEFDGKLSSEFDAVTGNRMESHNWDITPGDSESFRSIRARMQNFLDDITKEYVGKTIVVVSHGDPIWAAMSLEQSNLQADLVYPKNAEMVVREYDTSGSTVGDLNTYHPMDVLETGYDILPNWVSRMILMTAYALGEIPFKTVYLHGLVRDAEGRKMSKSLGNGIDPLDVIPKYGTDAVRMALLIGQTPGNDLRISEEKIAGFRNFSNKLWNVSRFILSMDGDVALDRRMISRIDLDDADLTMVDKWILSRLANVAKEFSVALDEYDFSRAGEMLRDFTWNDLADWYLECAKVEGGKYTVLNYVLQNLLKLWHPYMPFVTETIWQNAYAKDGAFLMIETWPDYTSMTHYPEAEREFAHVQNVVTAIRALRNDYKIPAAAIVPVSMVTKYKAELALSEAVIKKLTRSELLFVDVAPEGQLATVIEEGTITIPKFETAESPDEKIKLEAERDSVAHYITALKEKLGNADFVARAPAAVVEKEHGKLKEAEEKFAAIEARLK
ncbi:MAG: class I tRNA ligase family protein [Candidatus Magasanikbacteria bacterium]|nr:class I tRNA ligase family protein [Candidatus Magasanikbacteria bacterium]